MFLLPKHLHLQFKHNHIKIETGNASGPVFTSCEVVYIIIMLFGVALHLKSKGPKSRGYTTVVIV